MSDSGGGRKLGGYKGLWNSLLIHRLGGEMRGFVSHAWREIWRVCPTSREAECEE